MKGWKKTYNTNINQKKAGVAIYTVGFRTKEIPGMERNIT